MKLPRRRFTGQTVARRQLRITYRCLTIDLHEEMPDADIEIGTLDLPILAKARDLAPAYPDGQVRIQEIEDTMVYRFTHGRFRVATWLDLEADVMWVCAADERDDETYDYFVDLHFHDELLPTEDDSLRQEVEAAARFVLVVQADVVNWINHARANPAEEHIFELPGGALVRIFVRRGEHLEEIWIALPTLMAPTGLTDRMRAVVLATAEARLPESIWEQRYDWPAGELPNHEIAYLGVT